MLTAAGRGSIPAALLHVWPLQIFQLRPQKDQQSLPYSLTFAPPHTLKKDRPRQANYVLGLIGHAAAGKGALITRHSLCQTYSQYIQDFMFFTPFLSIKVLSYRMSMNKQCCVMTARDALHWEAAYGSILATMGDLGSRWENTQAVSGPFITGFAFNLTSHKPLAGSHSL